MRENWRSTNIPCSIFGDVCSECSPTSDGSSSPNSFRALLIFSKKDGDTKSGTRVLGGAAIDTTGDGSSFSISRGGSDDDLKRTQDCHEGAGRALEGIGAITKSGEVCSCIGCDMAVLAVGSFETGAVAHFGAGWWWWRAKEE